MHHQIKLVAHQTRRHQREKHLVEGKEEPSLSWCCPVEPVPPVRVNWCSLILADCWATLSHCLSSLQLQIAKSSLRVVSMISPGQFASFRDSWNGVRTATFLVKRWIRRWCDECSAEFTATKKKLKKSRDDAVNGYGDVHGRNYRKRYIGKAAVGCGKR